MYNLARPQWALLLLLILGSACGPGSDRAAAPIDGQSFTDDLGRTVQLPASIERIVPLAPSITETLFVAGAGRQVVAVSQADDFPPAVDSLPRFTSLPLDFEAIVSLEPDLVIATDEVNNPRDAHLFESLNIPIVYFTFNGWADVPRVLRRLGDLTGNASTAQEEADALDAKATYLTQQLDSVQTRPRVLFLIGEDALFAFGKGSYIHDLITVSGGESLTETLDTRAPVLSDEFVLTSQPDVIAGTFGEQIELLDHHPTFKGLPAVQNERICSISPSLVLRPGPRLIDGAAELAACIHPERFAQPTSQFPEP
jgi:iron complex transport system substrate-binding protein